MGIKNRIRISEMKKTEFKKSGINDNKGKTDNKIKNDNKSKNDNKG